MVTRLSLIIATTTVMKIVKRPTHTKYILVLLSVQLKRQHIYVQKITSQAIQQRNRGNVV